MVFWEPTRNTMIQEKASTTTVRMAVATWESVFLIPHFASMEVNPANRADANASRIHIKYVLPSVPKKIHRNPGGQA